MTATVRPERSTMLVAGLVFHTARGASPRVAARLRDEPGLTVHGGDGDRRVAAVLEALDAGALERRVEELLAKDDEIVGIFPTYVGSDEDASTAGEDDPGAPRPVAPDPGERSR